MARRRYRFERPAVAAHCLAVGERHVGTEIHVGGGVEPARLADMERPGQPVRALRVNLAPVAALTFGTAGEWSRWVWVTKI